MTNSNERMARILSESLALVQPPVAVCLTESAPESLARYSGTAPAGCVFWQQGASSTFVTSAADHALCAVGVHTHNLEPGPAQQSELGQALQIFAELGYLRSEDVDAVPVLQNRPKHVVYGPLSTTSATPDAVLLFVKSQAALVLSEACQQVEGGYPPAMGRPACGAIPQAINTGQAAYSLGCCGARAYLDTFSEDVAIFAIPGARLEAYVDRIQVLADANAVLTKFHQLRRRDVEAGKRPTIQQSLAAMSDN